MNVAIYVRVSTEQQAEKGYSIDTQIEACRQYSIKLGATKIIEFRDEGFSGEFLDRPALTRMRTAIVAKQIDIVVIYDPDRLSRNIYHQGIIYEEIDKAGVELKFVMINFDKSSDNMLLFNMRGVIAQYEKEKIKERTMRGKRGKASKGMVISDTKPFGYIFDSEKSTYMINQSEAKSIRLIFDLIINKKMGTARICKELNALGIPSPRAKKFWIVSSIHRLLTNTLYKGVIYSMKYRYEKIGLNKKKRTLRPESEWIPISIPAIVDEATWEAAQKQLQENKNFASRNLKHDYLLNGLVTCAKCGRAMIISHSGDKNHTSYYACLSKKSSSYIYAGQVCTARQVPCALLDKSVFEHFQRLLLNPDKIDISHFPEHDVQENQVTLEQFKNTEQNLIKQKDTILHWFKQQILTRTEAESQLNDIVRQLANITELKKNYDFELAVILPGLPTKEIIAIIKAGLRSDFPLEEKKAALRSIIDRVFVERVDNTRGRGSCPEINAKIKLK